MRFLVLIALLFLPMSALAVTGNDALFDWADGTPSLVVDIATECDGQAVALYSWANGSPAIVYDSTATCDAGEPPAPSEYNADAGVFWFY